jgi:serine O-acetyltransferase
MSTQLTESPHMRVVRPQPSAPTQAATPSAREPDWTREQPARWWDPSRQLLGAIRDYSQAQQRRGIVAKLALKLAVARHRFWSVVSGADIPLNTQALGGGLLLPHPQGVVIHPDAEIGPNCLLLQQVTLGTGPKPGVPKLGGHVDVGAGAKLLGGVVIGEHATIGANAVVISDVPPHAVAVGIPAVVKRRAPESGSSARRTDGPRSASAASNRRH